jgi:hypothetical protein
MALSYFPNQQHVLQVPCVVYHSPSALDSEANYGDLVGITDGPVVLQPLFHTAMFTKEPNGQRPVKELFNGMWWHITMRLKAHGNKALQLAFPSMVGTTAATQKDVRTPGAAAGSVPSNGVGMPTGTDLVTNYATRILIMPDDECAVNPCALIEKGVARVTDASIMLSDDNDLTYEVMIRAYDSGTTAVHRNFFFGNKDNVTLI